MSRLPGAAAPRLLQQQPAPAAIPDGSAPGEQQLASAMHGGRQGQGRPPAWPLCTPGGQPPSFSWQLGVEASHSSAPDLEGQLGGSCIAAAVASGSPASRLSALGSSVLGSSKGLAAAVLARSRSSKAPPPRLGMPSPLQPPGEEVTSSSSRGSSGHTLPRGPASPRSPRGQARMAAPCSAAAVAAGALHAAHSSQCERGGPSLARLRQLKAAVMDAASTLAASAARRLSMEGGELPAQQHGQQPRQQLHGSPLAGPPTLNLPVGSAPAAQAAISPRASPRCSANGSPRGGSCRSPGARRSSSGGASQPQSPRMGLARMAPPPVWEEGHAQPRSPGTQQPGAAAAADGSKSPRQERGSPRSCPH